MQRDSGVSEAKRSPWIGALLTWLVGLLISLSLGYATDLLLSSEARAAAMAFQRSTLALLEAFSPASLISQIGEAIGNIGPLPETGHPAKRFGELLAQFIANLHRSIGSLTTVPTWTIWLIHGLVFVVFAQLLWLTVNGWRSSTENPESESPSESSSIGCLSLPLVALLLCAFIAATYASSVVVVSVAMGVLKWIAIGALYAFGWITKLAGVAAVAGTVSSSGYFVLAKASEKRMGELAEGSLLSLLRRRA